LPDEARLIGAVLVSLFAVWLFTPLAIRGATRIGFFDHPVGYKGHGAPTPYLGGAAVFAGFLVAAALFGEGFFRFAAITACAGGLFVLGTLDDRYAVRPGVRVLAEVAAAVAISIAGLGWDFLDSGFEEAVLTSLWIVGFTNAFNLMDNMDGAACTVATVCSAGIAVVAATDGDVPLAAFALSLAGACLGFLRYNLRSKGSARIFLGDGGSMPLGFLLAAAAMNLPDQGRLGWPMLLLASLLLSVLVLDTLLVIVSRTRRRVALTTGGRDHLTHRLLTRLHSPRAVALTLALVQGTVSLVGAAVLQAGREAIIAAALLSFAVAAGAIALLDRPTGAPVESETSELLSVMAERR
jgi:UDP-GlcNAc:undecaprenyl-phosphate GlcNAc-1-phosphate transferase